MRPLLALALLCAATVAATQSTQFVTPLYHDGDDASFLQVEQVLGATDNEPALQNVPSLAAEVPMRKNYFDENDGIDPSKESGNFPGDNNYRRAVYGPRRRRVPFGNFVGGLGSVNPWHQFANDRNAPSDTMFTRNRFDVAKDPESTDFARLSRPFGLAYGGYSSFKNSIFRRAVADPVFRAHVNGNLGYRAFFSVQEPAIPPAQMVSLYPEAFYSDSEPYYSNTSPPSWVPPAGYIHGWSHEAQDLYYRGDSQHDDLPANK